VHFTALFLPYLQLEVFKKTLMQSLQEEDEDGAVSHCIDIHAVSSFYFEDPAMISEFVFVFFSCLYLELL
jgi:hypothetical protein